MDGVGAVLCGESARRLRADSRAAFAVLACVVAFLFFGLGSYLGARHSDREDDLAALRAEVALLRTGRLDAAGTAATGVAFGTAVVDDESRAAMIADIKRQLEDEMGLLPLSLLRNRRESFVELYAYDSDGGSSYGTAGYLGSGYFITVKHGVIPLADPGGLGRRRIVSIELAYAGRMLSARVIDAGDAMVEVDPGDWAIVKVEEAVDLPALNLNLGYGFAFANPIFRLGNDYSKGIIVSTGYIGQRTTNNLITCLTDGHPGVSGGGVLNQHGDLVGIPIGRMQGDYRFSFILPVRPEMFRKVEHIKSKLLAARNAAAADTLAFHKLSLKPDD